MAQSFRANFSSFVSSQMLSSEYSQIFYWLILKEIQNADIQLMQQALFFVNNFWFLFGVQFCEFLFFFFEERSGAKKEK